ncbi:YceD family protein [Thalassorhabdomicrobium marinisediminis]|uniref:DUF177 domain-containing protein n=1 Tax=Thalassorhabdomicrobium marinisediminis TaxID=2170577 RepID=A0A2T7G107_9RHOB|nr:YceD family protein [Thalassorhabdomicrobium marinisediminis]PVA08113.1 hypothetical protein DC363_01040 [Thalassorhabdomicrobium marinisediminis]
MSDLPRHRVRFADLPNRKRTGFDLQPDAQARAALAQELGVPGLRKFRFEGVLSPMGKSDWRLEGTLGATVEQACVVTLEPVNTRIDETVARTFMADFEYPAAEEVELTEDDTADPLPATLDLYDVALEALALALPAYPRKEGVETGTDGRAMFTEPGKTPMTDEEARPFAGLQALRDSLASKDETDD